MRRRQPEHLPRRRCLPCCPRQERSRRANDSPHDDQQQHVEHHPDAADEKQSGVFENGADVHLQSDRRHQDEDANRPEL